MTIEPGNEQTEAVKSAAQGPRPAAAQLAETVIETTQSPTRSDAVTLESIEPGKFPHEWWQQRFEDLKSERDTYARVCATYVIEREFEKAADCARIFAEQKQLLDEHLNLFRDYQAQMDAD